MWRTKGWLWTILYPWIQSDLDNVNVLIRRLISHLPSFRLSVALAVREGAIPAG